jgi:flagellar motility protein MotE (MotC chaperone)
VRRHAAGRAHRARAWLPAAVALLLCLPVPARGQEVQLNGQKAALGLITGSLDKAPPLGDPQRYCANVADAAADARFAWQAKTIADLEAEIDKRIQELEAKRAEYEGWLKQRDEILRKAEDHMVDIYARMRPESAAAQMAMLDDEMAAALLAKLDGRKASTILNEMEARRAAQLARLMVDINTGAAEKKKKP